VKKGYTEKLLARTKLPSATKKEISELLKKHAAMLPPGSDVESFKYALLVSLIAPPSEAEMLEVGTRAPSLGGYDEREIVELLDEVALSDDDVEEIVRQERHKARTMQHRLSSILRGRHARPRRGNN
jgi:hypothetical protein